MRNRAITSAAMLAVVLAASGAERSGKTATQNQSPQKQQTEIERFNAKFLEAHRKMDTPAILGMWAEDGVSLLPETAPMIGKPAITKFLTGVTEQLKGWRMEKMELEFQGVEVEGDWASEWALEHQVVRPPDASKPVFDGHGKMLLVLHREANGDWKITREMWNQGVKP